MAVEFRDMGVRNYYYDNIKVTTNIQQERDKVKNANKQQEEQEEFDYLKDDGIISTGDKIRNFGKGLIKPVTDMISSPENFLKGAAMIAGCAALTVATGGAALPFLVAVGVGMGTVQLGKSAYAAANAKTDQEAIAAWQGMGEGTSIAGLSVAGAKTSLKSAGVKTGNLNPLQSTAECFRNVPSSIGDSIKAFKSGKYKQNLGLESHSVTLKPTSARPTGNGKPPQSRNQNYEPEEAVKQPDNSNEHATQIAKEARERTLAEKETQRIADNSLQAYKLRHEKNLSGKSAEESAKVFEYSFKQEEAALAERNAKISELETMFKEQEKKNAEFRAKQEQEAKFADMQKILDEQKKAKVNSEPLISSVETEKLGIKTKIDTYPDKIVETKIKEDGEIITTTNDNEGHLISKITEQPENRLGTKTRIEEYPDRTVEIQTKKSGEITTTTKDKEGNIISKETKPAPKPEKAKKPVSTTETENLEVKTDPAPKIQNKVTSTTEELEISELMSKHSAEEKAKIQEARAILDKHGIEYSEYDLFKAYKTVMNLGSLDKLYTKSGTVIGHASAASFNPKLRNKTDFSLSSREKMQIAILDRGFETVKPINNPETVTRGVRASKYGFENEYDFLQRLHTAKPGDIIIDEGYAYATFNKNVSTHFGGNPNEDSLGAIMTIQIPTGAKVSLAKYSEQAECLFPRNAEFKVIKPYNPQTGEIELEYVLPKDS